MSETRRQVRICVGEAGLACGHLDYVRVGTREMSEFRYDRAWLSSAGRFRISPELELTEDRQFRRAPTRNDSVFPFAIADTAPDGWGCRVIARDYARRRKSARLAGRGGVADPLTEWDYLVAVDDRSRVGALRLQGSDGQYLRTIEDGERATPPLLELAQLLRASEAVERGTETAEDLRYLRGRGTSLGGLRPKCTIVDEDGHLAIGKFPSVQDARAVTQGEVLALRLARRAGINAADARAVFCEGAPVAIIRRFDRTPAGERIPYLSAASLLRANRDEDRAYTEIADGLIANGEAPAQDLEELWRRIVFNLLITNVDDHLQNHGFLHVGGGQWRLAPAFDVNPFPDKQRQLKLWLSEDTGPVESIDDVVALAPRFRLTSERALEVLGEVLKAVRAWRDVALSAPVAMKARELEAFEPAFEHDQAEQAAALLGWGRRG